MRFPTMWYVRPAKAQLEYSMNIKLLTENHLEFLSLKMGCRGLSVSTLVKLGNHMSLLIYLPKCLDYEPGQSKYLCLQAIQLNKT